jgi:hypothetical protein
MTKARDIRELIAEESTSPSERKALEAVADRVEEVVTQDVPYRPEFKAELRKQLLAQARRQSPPAWHRRPAVWGTAVALAAAAGIFAVGLSFWATSRPVPPKTGTVATPGPGNTVTVRPVAYSKLPAVSLPDEPLPAGAPGPAAPLPDVSKGLMTYKVPAVADDALFGRMVAGLTFAVHPTHTSEGWQVAQGARVLKLTVDGHFTYRDQIAPTPGQAPKVSAADAETAARQFLQKAVLAIPSQPVVLERTEAGAHLFKLVYTPKATGTQLPVVNALTELTVNDQGTVVAAEAYLLSGEQAHEPYEAVPPKDAQDAAVRAGGGSFSGIDLVYARTPDQGVVYLQPVWRVYGANTAGARFVRYVPALQKGQ